MYKIFTHIHNLRYTHTRACAYTHIHTHTGVLLDQLLEMLHNKLPVVEGMFWQGVDTIFAPKIVIRQYLLAIGRCVCVCACMVACDFF